MEAKRRLSNFDFSKKGCHVSVVSSKVGGPANGKPVLTLKALNKEEDKSMEMIEKSAHEALVLKAVQEAVEPVQKALNEANEKLQAVEAAKAEAVEKARKEAIADVIGKDNADLDATCAAVKSLDDDAFQIVLKGMKAGVVASEKSEMFTEKGVSGEKEQKATVSKEMEILQKNYKSK